MERLKLLFRLHYQFPKHDLCPECCIYHRRSKAATYEPADFILKVFEEEYTIKWSVLSAVAEDLRTSQCDTDAALKRLALRTGTSVALVNDRLLIDVRCHACLTIPVLQEGTYKEFRACNHAPTSSSLVKDAKRAIAAAPRPWEPQQAYKYKGQIFRCPYCPSEFGFFSIPIVEKELLPATGARFKLVLDHMIDFGRLLSPHDRTWAALTRPRHAGVVETVPYDTDDDVSIIQQYHEFKKWTGRLSDDAVLPLLD